jgi:uncharacterized membrane protein
MQSSFRRNLVLIGEAVLAFFSLELIQFLFGISNPVLLGVLIVSFSFVFFITTYLFVKRGERKTKVLGLNVQAELAS